MHEEEEERPEAIELSRKEFFYGDLNVPRNFSEQGRGDVLARMKGDGRAAAIGMAELFVAAALTNFHESEVLEKCCDLARFENWNGSQGLGHPYGLDPDELRLDFGFTIFEQHRDNFL